MRPIQARQRLYKYEHTRAKDKLKVKTFSSIEVLPTVHEEKLIRGLYISRRLIHGTTGKSQLGLTDSRDPTIFT